MRLPRPEKIRNKVESYTIQTKKMRKNKCRGS